MITRGWKMADGSSTVGAASSTRRAEYAAPAALKSIVSALLQRCRTYGAGASRAMLVVFCFVILHSLFCLSALGQSYSVDWYKVAGGGGTSAGGTYTVNGTIGQHDAGGAMTGGNYSVTGGYWSFINVVQTPGLPSLIITPNGANSVQVLWPDPATNNYTLQQNANLATTNWTTSGFTISNVGGTNSITVTPPVGNLFFRLKQ